MISSKPTHLLAFARSVCNHSHGTQVSDVSGHHDSAILDPSIALSTIDGYSREAVFHAIHDSTVCI